MFITFKQSGYSVPNITNAHSNRKTHTRLLHVSINIQLYCTSLVTFPQQVHNVHVIKPSERFSSTCINEMQQQSIEKRQNIQHSLQASFIARWLKPPTWNMKTNVSCRLRDCPIIRLLLEVWGDLEAAKETKKLCINHNIIILYQV